jgi:hypothetical protein
MNNPFPGLEKLGVIRLCISSYQITTNESTGKNAVDSSQGSLLHLSVRHRGCVHRPGKICKLGHIPYYFKREHLEANMDTRSFEITISLSSFSKI